MSAGHSQVRLLGPVDVTIDGATRQVSGLRRKSVLAVLGLHPGEVVSTDRIVDIVWNAQPPATVVKTLHNGISYLRDVLSGRAAIVASRPGYRLELPADATDVTWAESLIRRPANSADHVRRAAQLRSALSLWRG